MADREKFIKLIETEIEREVGERTFKFKAQRDTANDELGAANKKITGLNEELKIARERVQGLEANIETLRLALKESAATVKAFQKALAAVQE